MIKKTQEFDYLYKSYFSLLYSLSWNNSCFCSYLFLYIKFYAKGCLLHAKTSTNPSMIILIKFKNQAQLKLNTNATSALCLNK
ncbi:unnamed protein product [Blepharisma stoltei]|uniref:Uncharacterized protein n=1 Tax=Blepharisma stoltei TaxID=1481888 RepID=A0AAU9KEN4_9CILI|nr:unnamed protein product [Blepharisma stoltei]